MEGAGGKPNPKIFFFRPEGHSVKKGGDLAIDYKRMVTFVCFYKGFWNHWSRKTMDNPVGSRVLPLTK